MPKKPADNTYFQNRELSWLKFNERVLNEANRQELPLIERLKFISIFTSNLDEFFMVRVGTLTDYALFDKKYLDNKTGMTAGEQLDKIFNATKPLYAIRDQAFSSITKELSENGIKMLKIPDLSEDDLKTVKKYFTQNIMPLLSPQIIDTRHPFPHLANKQLHIAVMMEKKKGHLFGLIAIPAEPDRMVFLEGGCRFVLLEDIVLHFADSVFNIYKVLSKNIISITRNADINIEEESYDEGIDYRLHMKKILKKRQRLSPVRMELAYPADKKFLDFFCNKLSLDTSQVFYSMAPLDLSFCLSLDYLSRRETKNLILSTHVPAETLPANRKVNVMKFASSSKDMLFSYPYENISFFLSLVSQSAEDNSVLSIKITLYRIDLQSKLAESLILAAENDKEVVVLMELRARFDEKNNIEWAQRLEEAGCRVIYGIEGYKVHSKICLITRKEFGKIHYITQIGTGNYNEKTSRQYTDLSLVTANQDIGSDATNFFSNLLLGNLEGEYAHLWVAPNGFKNNILQCIEDERIKSVNGSGGAIIIKCNSLTDKDVIDKLTEASRDGVKINMIVRGICCLVPQISDATENIHVISIVGRFLEHSRIFCFGTGSETKIYISSGDLMTRNTERRVEVACPIYDDDLKEKISGMLEVMLRDNTHAWEQFSDGRYVLRKPADEDISIDSQALFTEEARLKSIREETKKSKVVKSNEEFSIPHILHLAKQFFIK